MLSEGTRVRVKEEYRNYAMDSHMGVVGTVKQVPVGALTYFVVSFNGDEIGFYNEHELEVVETMKRFSVQVEVIVEEKDEDDAFSRVLADLGGMYGGMQVYVNGVDEIEEEEEPNV